MTLELGSQCGKGGNRRAMVWNFLGSAKAFRIYDGKHYKVLQGKQAYHDLEREELLHDETHLGL